jgi:hypothetical protein
MALLARQPCRKRQATISQVPLSEPLEWRESETCLGAAE